MATAHGRRAHFAAGACAYKRYIAFGRGPESRSRHQNVQDFNGLYWREQVSTSGLMVGLSLGAARPAA